MREARMTFGEHLEELRKRIIFCLIYLAVGVTISLVYGKQLMEWTLGPHYHAIRAAQRDRLVAHMEKTLHRLDELTSVEPVQPPPGEKPLVEGAIHWPVLFVADVALPQIIDRLKEPFGHFAAALRGSLRSLPEEEKERVGQAVESLGSELSSMLVKEFAPGLQGAQFGDFPARFLKIKKLLQETEDTAGPDKLKRLVGWGKDVKIVLEPLEGFLQFLERQRLEAAQSNVPLDLLQEWVRDSKLPDGLNTVLASLEKDAKDIVEEKPKPLIVLSYIESFSAYLKVAFIFGIFLTLPFMLFEMWKFIGAGLHPHEQAYVVTLLPFSLGLFVVGTLFGYFAMIPVGLEFLASWGIQEVDLSFALGSYIDLFFTLTLILGLVFQTPLIMVFLSKIGIITVDGFRKFRKPAIFIEVVLAVVLTPPDPFSWSLMAVPMVLLYEVGILASKLMEKKRPLRAPVVEEVETEEVGRTS
jgi:Tat protein translocase TatC